MNGWNLLKWVGQIGRDEIERQGILHVNEIVIFLMSFKIEVFGMIIATQNDRLFSTLIFIMST